MKILILDVIDLNKETHALDNIMAVLNTSTLNSFHFSAQKLHEIELIEEELAAADKIIISGSTRSAYQDFHWKPRLKNALQLILKINKPTYAICFGAQFVAHELGGEVVCNPLGPEFGSVTVKLTELGQKHPLLEGFHQSRQVHANHYDCIKTLPDQAVLLAYNDNSEVQAFQYKNIFATQFHSNFPSTYLHNMLINNKNSHLENGFFKNDDHFQEILENLPLGEASYEILQRFLEQ